MKYLPLIFLTFLLLNSCTSDPQVETPSSDNPVDVPASPKQIEPSKLTVGIDHLRLRESAGEKGEEVALLSKGTVLYETGEVSDFTTRVKLRGIWFDEPWIKVKTDKGIEGWVFAGAVTFDMDNPSELSSKLLDMRLTSFFGKGLATESLSYRKDYLSAKTSEDFSILYRKGEQLRDTMVTILESKIDVTRLDYEKLPDLFWIEEGLPGYETALAAEGTIYYLFRNFKDYQKLAKKTAGLEDDDFINLNLKVHAHDSIEYFFPVWFLQTWDYGGHSLMGQGKHYDILSDIDREVKKSDLFLGEMMKTKDALLLDITNEHITYWEPQEKIIAELDKIINSDFDVLANDDKIALETRKKMFEDYKANKIEVNMRAGTGE